ncbi:ABC transporter ATP-binding protein [Brevibacterium senegalense]|uniref:ABC transporter ATP-binding protein n=1 Tax=Brevibacterium senegalense TaxID=1033736 RepID=UPI00137602C5|nr:ABC transporter ATP-binding protein [Brevibacterium senegalense]
MLVATDAPGAGQIIDLFSRFGLTDTGAVIIALAGFIGSVFVLKSVSALLIRRWQLGKQNVLEAEASVGLLKLYSSSPYDVHRTRDTAEVQRQLNFSVHQVISGVLGGLLNLSVDGLTILLTVIVLGVISPIGLATATLVFGTTIVGTQLFSRSRARRTGLQMSDQELAAWSSLLPLIEGFREVRLTGSASRFLEAFASSKRKSAIASRNLSVISELPKYALEVSLILGIGAIAAVISIAGDPNQTVAVLGVFAAAAGRITPTLNRLAFTLVQIRSASVSVEVLEDELDTLPNVGSVDSSAMETDQADVLSGDIVLNDVGYHYPDAQDWSVRHVSTVIPQGSSVAIAGSSGAGKSTLLDLVLGLFTPREGSITVEGASIHEHSQAWMRSLGVVSQDVYLVNASVRANIAFGVPDDLIDDERLRRAIADAQLDDLVDELPDGLSTRLGERGVRISGGQRQRIGIARALYRQPKVLVLDEATSALDNKTENLITRTINSLSGQLTIVIVAHRLSTIRNVDKLIYMSKGTVEAEGTFDEVTASSAEFAELVELGRLN